MNFGKTYFSESFPELWLFVIGFLFIAVVMVFPNGLAGIDFVKMRAFFESWLGRIKKPSVGLAIPPPAPSRPSVSASRR